MASDSSPRQRRTGLRRGLIAALCAAVSVAVPVGAQERLWLAGTELSADNSYSYAGLLLPAFGGNLGDGFVQRYWVDRLTYRYDSAGRRIEAESLGAEAALGYVRPTTGGSLSGMLGVLYRDTDLSPDDPDSAARGSQWRLKAQGESTQRMGDDLELGLMASYVFGQRAYWSRARLGFPVGDTLRIGPELSLQGDPDYRVTQYGAFLSGLRLGTGIQAGLKAGIRDPRDEGTQAYVGLEVTGLF